MVSLLFWEGLLFSICNDPSPPVSTMGQPCSQSRLPPPGSWDTHVCSPEPRSRPPLSQEKTAGPPFCCSPGNDHAAPSVCPLYAMRKNLIYRQHYPISSPASEAGSRRYHPSSGPPSDAGEEIG